MPVGSPPRSLPVTTAASVIDWPSVIAPPEEGVVTVVETQPSPTSLKKMKSLSASVTSCDWLVLMRTSLKQPRVVPKRSLRFAPPSNNAPAGNVRSGETGVAFAS